MSRKTKAELEEAYMALNGRYKALGVMYAALEKRCGQLEDQNKNLQGYIDLLSEMVDTDQRDFKVTNKALDDAIKKHIDYRNTADHSLYNYNKGPIAKKRKAKEKQKYFVESYNHWLAEGKRPETARKKANEDVKKKYGKGYEKSSLYKYCRDTDNSIN